MFQQNSIISPIFQYILFLLVIILTGLAIYYMIYIGNRAVKDNKKLHINWKRLVKFIGLIILFVIISALYKRYSILGRTTFAVFVSILVAFLLNPIVTYFETKGITRGRGTILTYVIILLVVTLLFVAFIPELITEVGLFLENLPSTINYTYNALIKVLNKWNIDTQVLDKLMTQLNDYLIGLADNIPQWATSIINTIQGSIGTMVTIVLIPLITYHLLVSKDRLFAWLYLISPKSIRHDAMYLFREINFSMNEFVKSRLLMSVFIGVATWIMLTIFGIPFAFVIGFITMLLDIVPYIGPVLATAPALIFALIKSPILFLVIAFLCWVLQWIEQNIVGAKLFANSSGIHELLILLSIIIGGGMFGVWGMILSVPLLIIVKIIIDFVSMKMKGIKPEFTKAREKQIMKEMKRKEKAERARRKRERQNKK